MYIMHPSLQGVGGGALRRLDAVPLVVVVRPFVAAKVHCEGKPGGVPFVTLWRCGRLLCCKGRCDQLGGSHTAQRCMHRWHERGCPHRMDVRRLPYNCGMGQLRAIQQLQKWLQKETWSKSYFRTSQETHEGSSNG